MKGRKRKLTRYAPKKAQETLDEDFPWGGDDPICPECGVDATESRHEGDCKYF